MYINNMKKLLASLAALLTAVAPVSAAPFEDQAGEIIWSSTDDYPETISRLWQIAQFAEEEECNEYYCMQSAYALYDGYVYNLTRYSDVNGNPERVDLNRMGPLNKHIYYAGWGTKGTYTITEDCTLIMVNDWSKIYAGNPPMEEAPLAGGYSCPV